MEKIFPIAMAQSAFLPGLATQHTEVLDAPRHSVLVRVTMSPRYANAGKTYRCYSSCVFSPDIRPEIRQERDASVRGNTAALGGIFVARQRPGIAKRDRTRGDPVTEQSSGLDREFSLAGDEARAATVAESLESIISGASSLPGIFVARGRAPAYRIRGLAATNWVIEGEKGAARILDVHPNTLRSRMKKLNIQRPGEAPTNGEPAYGDKSPFLAETGSGL
jgi:hypothetical protein